MKKQINNIKDLREELTEVFIGLRNKTIKPVDAKEANNSAGKIINTCKVQIDYNNQMGAKRKIAFLEVEGE